MSSASPEREPVFSANLRVVKPSDPTTAPPSSPPYAGPKPVGPGFMLGWSIFRISVWATVAVWINPHILDLVGGERFADWLVHHRLVHMLCLPPLGMLLLISWLEVLNDPKKRAAREALAGSMGATVVDLRPVDPTDGMPDGPGLRVPLGRWSAVIGTWTRQGDAHTVARVSVDARSGLSFVARGTAREPAMMRGLQQFAMGHALRHAAVHANDPRAVAAVAALAYMSEAPITTGNAALDRAVVLRANHPDAARAMITAPEVANALAALNERTRRWDWTLHPTAVAGKAEMRLECPGALKDSDSLRAVQALLRAALEQLAAAGVVTG